MKSVLELFGHREFHETGKYQVTKTEKQWHQKENILTCDSAVYI